MLITMIANTKICLTQHWGEGRAPHICRWIVMETQVFQLNVTTIVACSISFIGKIVPTNRQEERAPSYDNKELRIRFSVYTNKKERKT